jgi:hypothetical protein
MNTIRYSLIILLTVISPALKSQDQENPPAEEKHVKVSLNGYLKFLQTIQFEKIDEDWTTDNVFHNRLNFKWYPTRSITFTAEARTRLFYGATVRKFPQYADIIDDDSGYLTDLSGIVSRGNSYFIHSAIDRLNVDWSSGSWQVRLGRQRINWGQTFVWNPNDIFNAYSFFDFDYEERPGSDAAVVRYYTGATSSIEFATAFAPDWDDYKIAAMYRWNRGEYDYQLLTGKVGTDYAIGAGWSGQIKTAGFKGELTWLEPLDDFFSGAGGLVGSLSLDYTFTSSLFLHSEVIYNSFATDVPAAAGALNFLSDSRSPKTLTFTDWSWFNEASYQITPLLKMGLYSMYNPGDESVFLGPNLELSVSDNVYLLFMGQFFVGPSRSIYGSLGYFNYLRLKWSF